MVKLGLCVAKRGGLVSRDGGRGKEGGGLDEDEGVFEWVGACGGGRQGAYRKICFWPRGGRK